MDYGISNSGDPSVAFVRMKSEVGAAEAARILNDRKQAFELYYTYYCSILYFTSLYYTYYCSILYYTSLYFPVLVFYTTYSSVRMKSEVGAAEAARILNDRKQV